MDERTDMKLDDGYEAEKDSAVEQKSVESSGKQEGLTRKKKILIGIGVAAVLACAVGGVALAGGMQASPASPESQKDAPVKEATEEKKAEKSNIVVKIVAEGADDAYTPAKIEVRKGGGEKALETAEVKANTEATACLLEEGDYELTVVAAPVGPDGTSYKIPDAPTAVKVGPEGEDVRVEVALEKVAVEDMTAEELEAASAALEAIGNAEAAQNIAAKAASAPSASESGSTSQGGSSAPAAGSTGGSSGGSASAHVHSWVPVTEIRWIQDKDSVAWDEPVYSTVEREICNTCGADVTGYANQHLLDSGRGGCQSWRSEVSTVQTGTIHHEATGHNETVTVGYSCSGCGATK